MITVIEPEHMQVADLRREQKQVTILVKEVYAMHRAGVTPRKFDIPDKYTLGERHDVFFYDKLSWLTTHYASIHAELKRRDLCVNEAKALDVAEKLLVLSSTGWGGVDYVPAPDDVYLSWAYLLGKCKLPEVLSELS